VSFLLVLLVTFGAALLSASAVGISIRVANRTGHLDHPDGGRKTQVVAIPKLGGVAIAISFGVIAVVSVSLLSYREYASLAAAVVLPAIGASVVGYVDDLRHLPPKLRLGLQAVFALLAWALGTRILFTGLWWADALLTVLWFMIVVNGVNLLDNSDGLAGSTVLVSALGASIIAVIFGQEFISLLGFALVGICIGYLWHNWYPASVYMGDSGAYFLGFLLASLVVRLRPDTMPPAWGALVALLLVALPVLDMTYVIFKRLRSGIHPFTAGRDHMAHVLQDRGASVAGSVVKLQSLLVSTTVLAIVIVLIFQAR
jgi:UDP-GlcNAc:undecaprenyl-phosphate GlcNAc-1-phosphate transferase